MEDDRAGRHVTAQLQFLVFFFLFSFFWPKKPFFFFSLNKGKHNQAPYEYILEGYNEFFEKKKKLIKIGVDTHLKDGWLGVAHLLARK